MEKDTVIAIPSDLPGGLDAPRSGHFGRCDAFTLVTLRGPELVSSRVVPNAAHAQGGCLGPVELLFREGAHAVIVAGIGARPLTGFRNAGIQVLVGAGERVRDVVDGYVSGAARPVGEEDLCGGGGHAHNHGS